MVRRKQAQRVQKDEQEKGRTLPAAAVGGPDEEMRKG